jgi:hypothetical protein
MFAFDPGTYLTGTDSYREVQEGATGTPRINFETVDIR